MKNLIFFYRKRGDKDILQAMEWKSFSDAAASDKDAVLKLLGSGDYIQTTTFMPTGMTKGGEKD